MVKLKVMIVAAAVVASTTPAFAAAPKAKSSAAKPAAPKPKPSPPHVIPETGVFNAEDLVAVAKQVLAAKPDQFSDSPGLKYVGREFQIKLEPVFDFEVKYDKPKNKLTFTTSRYSPNWYIGRELIKSSYRAVNAFGVTFDVNKTRGSVYSINAETGGPFFASYECSVTLNPDEARALSEAVTAKASGRLKRTDRALSVGNLLDRDVTIQQPTFSSPTDNDYSDWQFAVEDMRVEFTDSRTGLAVCPPITQRTPHKLPGE